MSALPIDSQLMEKVKRCLGRKKREGRARPPFPTQARPGSPEKVAILVYRARLRVALWHPDDAVLPNGLPND